MNEKVIKAIKVDLKNTAGALICPINLETGNPIFIEELWPMPKQEINPFFAIPINNEIEMKMKEIINNIML